jgi:hypothetical protein
MVEETYQGGTVIVKQMPYVDTCRKRLVWGVRALFIRLFCRCEAKNVVNSTQ